MPPATKKRKITTKPTESISFDPSAREEYLTGFHKRKVARQKHAQEEAAKREKEEKLRFRRELRQQRKTDLEAHVEEVNRLVKQANGDIPGLDNVNSSDNSSDNDDEETFTGFSEPAPINLEDEYIDEDKYTTVTIESVDISRQGFSKPNEPSPPHDNDKPAAAVDRLGGDGGGGGDGGIKRSATGKRIWTKDPPARTEWPKKKKPKFRYESKAERKVTRMKEGAKKRKARGKRGKGKEE